VERVNLNAIEPLEVKRFHLVRRSQISFGALHDVAYGLGPLPRIDVITVSVTDLVPMKLELSPAVAATLPEVARQVRALVH
jgi:hypothetical protein